MSAEKSEAARVDAFQADIAQQWKKLAMEIRSIGPMLEKVVEAWKHYSSYTEIITSWLSEGEKLMKMGSADQIQVSTEYGSLGKSFIFHVSFVFKIKNVCIVD